MISIQLDKKRSRSFPGKAIAFVMCANNVVVSHNALKKIWRSHIFATQSQWHLSNTKTGDTAYQATCTT
ncbi:hypothetical protein [Nostoc commune]|uniref:hypothetical protein n=1 Tax=Nostoc commune TaxID=1178 RepID=UPI0018C476FE|nr:hypothetical protein [Nostoc commune]MBG1260627.1 hypothetical protein [Nostoc commune BAE]